MASAVTTLAVCVWYAILRSSGYQTPVPHACTRKWGTEKLLTSCAVVMTVVKMRGSILKIGRCKISSASPKWTYGIFRFPLRTR